MMSPASCASPPRRPLAGRTVLAAATAMIAVIASGCGGSSSQPTVKASAPTTVSTPTAKQRGGSIVLARSSEPTTFDPNTGATDPGTLQAQIQVFDQLVETVPGNDSPQPGLAKAWHVSSDGLTYTFTLRAAKFSDGSPVTAADAKFSLDRSRDVKFDPGFGGFFDFIKSTAAPSATSLIVTLKEPTPAFLRYLTFNVPSVISRSAFQRLGAKRFAQHPVGSGAFVVKSWARGSDVVLERNPHYWRTSQPYLDQVTLKYVPDDNSRVLLARSHGADVVDDIPFSQVAALRGMAGLDMLVRDVGANDNVWFNTDKKPFSDKYLRRALMFATPIAAISKAVFFGIAPPSNSIFPKQSNWDRTVPVPPLDLSRARAELAKSGTPQGLSMTLTYVGSDQAGKQTASILQSAWGKIGVKVKLQPLDLASLFALMPKGAYDALLFTPTTDSYDVPAEDEFVNNLARKGYPFTYFGTTPVPALSKTFTAASTPSARLAAFAKLQRAYLEDPHALPLVFTPARAAVSANIHNFDFVSTNWWRLDRVWKGAS
jgi:peptide/nickel transport system substrate-binding protein